ncbi:hypothetical protein GCM10009675_32690 [Prauserella alba]|uniref:Uncharacterized protein n=1 Tax=Prauserella alba TaxID=176898 RepID=A0ABN1VFZ1_9PSEU
MIKTAAPDLGAERYAEEPGLGEAVEHVSGEPVDSLVTIGDPASGRRDDIGSDLPCSVADLAGLFGGEEIVIEAIALADGVVRGRHGSPFRGWGRFLRESQESAVVGGYRLASTFSAAC